MASSTCRKCAVRRRNGQGVRERGCTLEPQQRVALCSSSLGDFVLLCSVECDSLRRSRRTFGPASKRESQSPGESSSSPRERLSFVSRTRSLSRPLCTDTANGALAIDLNADHIAATLVSGDGRLLDTWRWDLRPGHDNIQNAARLLAVLATTRGVPIVAEDPRLPEEEIMAQALRKAFRRSAVDVPVPASDEWCRAPVSTARRRGDCGRPCLDDQAHRRPEAIRTATELEYIMLRRSSSGVVALGLPSVCRHQSRPPFAPK